MTPVKFHRSDIVVLNSDILFQESDALICPCFDTRNHDNGVCRQIKIRAGENLMSDLARRANSETSFQTGSHRLAIRRIRSIIHLYNQSDRTNYDGIKTALLSGLDLVNEKKIKSISLGSLNASVFKLSYSSISTLILDCLESAFKQPENSMERIYIVDSNENFLTQFREALDERIKS